MQKNIKKNMNFMTTYDIIKKNICTKALFMTA